GDGRGRPLAGPEREPRAHPDGHPAAGHERDRRPDPAARRRGDPPHSRDGGHGVGNDSGPPEDPRRRIRRLSVEAHRRERLPRAGGTAAGGRSPGSRAMTPPPAKILVVDDTPQNVKLLADLLTVKGYAVVTAASGAEALARIDAERPDLVL